MIEKIRKCMGRRINGSSQIGYLQIRMLIKLVFMHDFFQLVRQSPALFRADLYAFILFFRYRFCLHRNRLFFFHDLYLLRGLSFSTPEEIIASTGQQYCYNNPPSKPTTENRSDFHLQQSFRIRFPIRRTLTHKNRKANHNKSLPNAL